VSIAALTLLRLAPAIEGTTQLGYQSSLLVPLGMIQAIWLFTHVLFPVYVAALPWGGLWLCDARASGRSCRSSRGDPRSARRLAVQSGKAGQAAHGPRKGLNPPSSAHDGQRP
jgi:hypothetical protein